MWRRPACQALPKALNISSATAWVVPDLLKDLSILSDTTVRRSAVDQEDLKQYWKLEVYLKVFQRLYEPQRDVGLSPTFLNTGTTDETFQQSGKQDSFRYLLKISVSM